MIPAKLVVATSNAGKMREIRKIFAGTNVELSSLKDIGWEEEIIESGSTFAENAEIKARAVYDKIHLPVLAEDSGLVVDILNGEPGIFSARYAGEGGNDKLNNEKLLGKIRDTEGIITAAFVCSAIYIDDTGILRAEGKLEGQIIKTPRGTNGFGYDPVFMPDGYDITTAEMDPDFKNSISHRGQAIKKLRKLMSGDEVQ